MSKQRSLMSNSCSLMSKQPSLISNEEAAIISFKADALVWVQVCAFSVFLALLLMGMGSSIPKSHAMLFSIPGEDTS